MPPKRATADDSANKKRVQPPVRSAVAAAASAASHQPQGTATLPPPGLLGGIGNIATSGAPKFSRALASRIMKVPKSPKSLEAHRQKVVNDVFALMKPHYVAATLNITPRYAPKLVSDIGEYEPKEIPHDAGRPGGTVNLSPNAFASPAVLHSTMFHELIHAEQYRPHQEARWGEYKRWLSSQRSKKQSKKSNDAFDNAVGDKLTSTVPPTFAYHDRHVPKASKAMLDFQKSAQEIEAHVAEINHASHTGIDGKNVMDPLTPNLRYLDGRVGTLQRDHLPLLKRSYPLAIKSKPFNLLPPTEQQRYHAQYAAMDKLARGAIPLPAAARAAPALKRGRQPSASSAASSPAIGSAPKRPKVTAKPVAAAASTSGVKRSYSPSASSSPASSPAIVSAPKRRKVIAQPAAVAAATSGSKRSRSPSASSPANSSATTAPAKNAAQSGSNKRRKQGHATSP